MTTAIAERTYRSDPVLDIQPGDPIPIELSGPFAVLVTPALAEYFLTLNKVNRGLKTRIAQFAADMVSGRWAYPTTSLHFDTLGTLKNGQNRLMAALSAQIPVCMRVEFGWEDGSLDVMDQGSARTTGDVMQLHGVADKNTVAAAVAVAHKYSITAGSSRSWTNAVQSNYQPSAVEALAEYEADEEAWRVAVSKGRSLAKALDHALTPSVWAAAYYICAQASPQLADLFFGQVASVDGPRSDAAQALRDYQMRRRVKDTRTGDKREPLENIIRAFKAHTAAGKPSFVRMPGFVLTRAPQVF